jgi:hypothetical protein
MGIVVSIFRQTYTALRYGSFQVDTDHSVYGAPARVVGVLILYVGLFAVIDGIMLGIVYKGQPRDPLYIYVRIWTTIGSILVAYLICRLFREPHRGRRYSDEGDQD